jgi:hypothetical protein
VNFVPIDRFTPGTRVKMTAAGEKLLRNTQNRTTPQKTTAVVLRRVIPDSPVLLVERDGKEEQWHVKFWEPDGSVPAV